MYYRYLCMTLIQFLLDIFIIILNNAIDTYNLCLYFFVHII